MIRELPNTVQRLPKKMIGDGNCLFRAIADQLERIGIAENYQTLRDKVSEYYLRNGRVALDYDFQLFHSRSREEYAHFISRDGEWGCEIDIKVLAMLYNVYIVVVYPNPKVGMRGSFLYHIINKDGSETIISLYN
jgi:hypothetical protein